MTCSFRTLLTRRYLAGQCRVVDGSKVFFVLREGSFSYIHTFLPLLWGVYTLPCVYPAHFCTHTAHGNKRSGPTKSMRAHMAPKGLSSPSQSAHALGVSKTPNIIVWLQNGPEFCCGTRQLRACKIDTASAAGSDHTSSTHAQQPARMHERMRARLHLSSELHQSHPGRLHGPR